MLALIYTRTLLLDAQHQHQTLSPHFDLNSECMANGTLDDSSSRHEVHCVLSTLVQTVDSGAIVFTLDFCV